MASIEEKQKIEIEFWRDSEHESPEVDSIYNIINKVSEAAVFVDCLNRHREKLVGAGKVLEIGGGQGWASCIYKRLFPQAYVTLTDISEFAIKSLRKWERYWDVKVDNCYAYRSYETNESDSSIDMVFCFASAHHFIAYNRTLREINRILKPDGKAFWFYEPSCLKFFYPLACAIVKRKRKVVPEDVLITKSILRLACNNGLNATVDFYPSLLRRGPFETVYFYFLGLMPSLQKLFPSTVNFIFSKRSSR
ncbi:MAG TPA: class I SAM-dependent methyltransferase [Deltaproteobacteria bacterium]|jgi:ubiquinone/menaquinone biosynthesis C-methylase UbiE|nr:class I SAM-dependent methyltransferase [Deltaproteobacteria bacterium]